MPESHRCRREPTRAHTTYEAIYLHGRYLEDAVVLHVEGAVRLREQLRADYDVSTLDTTVTEEVVRVRVVTQAVTPYLGGALGRLVVGSRAYHDVEVSPLAFDDPGGDLSSAGAGAADRDGAGAGCRAAACRVGRADRRPGRHPAFLMASVEVGPGV